MIDNPIQTQRALLTWQRPLGYQGRRDRFAVGELTQTAAGVRFSYLAAGVVAASEQGFVGYPGLRLGASEESYDALRVLLRRLPPRERADFGDFLRSFGIAAEANLSDLSLLAYTGARVASDSDGFGISETFDGFARPFRYVFDISGYRHYREFVPNLQINDSVRFVAEVDNEYDPEAVMACTVGDQCIGYVNRTQAPLIRSWLAEGSIDAFVFRINGRSSYPRLFVMADIIPQLQSVKAA